MINKIIEELVNQYVTDQQVRDKLIPALIVAVKKFIGGPSMNRMGATIMTETSSSSADKKGNIKPTNV